MAGCIGGVNGDCGRKTRSKVQNLCVTHEDAKRRGESIFYDIGRKPKKNREISKETIPSGWFVNLDQFWDKKLNNNEEWRGFKPKSGKKVTLIFQGIHMKYKYKMLISAINRKKEDGSFIYTESSLPPHTWKFKPLIVGETDLETNFPEIAKEFVRLVDSPYFTSPREIMPGTSKRALWVCRKGHESTLAVNGRIDRKFGCQVCRKKSSLAVDMFPEWKEIFVRSFGNPLDMLSSGSGDIVALKCLTPGTPDHTYEISVRGYKYGTRCGFCFGNKVSEWNSFASTESPKIVSEFVKKDGYKDITEVKRGSQLMGWWICENGHEWKAPFLNRSQGSGCRRCEKGNSSMDLADIFQRIVSYLPHLPYVDQLMIIEASGIYLPGENAKPIREALRGDKSWDEAMAELAGDDFEESNLEELIEEDEKVEAFSEEQDDEDLSGDDILSMMDGDDEPEIPMSEVGEMLEKSLGPGYLDELGEYFVARLLAERWKKEIDKVDHGM